MRVWETVFVYVKRLNGVFAGFGAEIEDMVGCGSGIEEDNSPKTPVFDWMYLLLTYRRLFQRMISSRQFH